MTCGQPRGNYHVLCVSIAFLWKLSLHAGVIAEGVEGGGNAYAIFYLEIFILFFYTDRAFMV